MSVDADSHANPHASATVGLLMGLGAYLTWGGIVVYFKAVGHVPPVTLISHRVIASVPLVLGLALCVGGLSPLRRILTTPSIRRVLPLTSLLIGANWLFFIYCVHAGKVATAALSYFLAPLMMVLLGVLLLGDRLSRLQAVGLGLATVGLVTLAAANGELPWLSIVIALTWTFYSYLRKTRDVPAVEGLAAELTLLALPAAVWLTYVGWIPPRESSPYTPAGELLMILLGGVVTAVPLILFGGAARRISLTTLGFLQYLAPAIQFALAVTLYREPFGTGQAVAFGFIWAALACYSADSLVSRRKRRLPAAVPPATPPVPAVRGVS